MKKGGRKEQVRRKLGGQGRAQNTLSANIERGELEPRAKEEGSAGKGP